MKHTITARAVMFFLAASLFTLLLAAAGCGGESGKVKVMAFIGESSPSAADTQAMIDTIKKDYKDKVIVEEIDYDNPENKDLLEEYHITMNPTVIVFNTEGKIKQQFLGKPMEQELMNSIEAYLPGDSRSASTTPSTPGQMQVQTVPMDNGAQGSIPGATVVPDQ